MSTISCSEDDSRSWARRLFLLCLALASIHMVSNACQPGGSWNQCNACEQDASQPLVVRGPTGASPRSSNRVSGVVGKLTEDGETLEIMG